MNHYRFVYQGGSGEIEEKKSRFIAHVKEISTEQEALDFLAAIRKKYWDARHHCWAYVTGDDPAVERMSDDGEPAGTAGKPILEVIRGRKLTNVLVVVTRYFGGTLLGTGGLVRAYTSSAAAGLDHSKIITKIRGFKLKITTDYTGLGKIQYILGERGIPVLDSSYTEKVELTALVPEALWPALEEELTDGTNGKAVLEEAGKCFYGDIDGKIQVLE